MTTPSLRPGESEIQTDNARARITQWRLPPNSETGHHRHAFDYAVVPLTNGTLTIYENGETKESPLQLGKSYFRAAGVEHNVTNQGDFEIVFVEVEFKSKGDVDAGVKNSQEKPAEAEQPAEAQESGEKGEEGSALAGFLFIMAIVAVCVLYATGLLGVAWTIFGAICTFWFVWKINNFLDKHK